MANTKLTNPDGEYDTRFCAINIVSCKSCSYNNRCVLQRRWAGDKNSNDIVEHWRDKTVLY